MYITKTYKRCKPLCFVDDNNVLVWKNSMFYLLNTTSGLFRVISKKKVSSKFLLSKNRLTERIFRLEPRTAIMVDKAKAIISIGGTICLINIDTGNISKIHGLRRHMSGVLSFCKVENISSTRHGIYYGEYFQNPDKKAVSIYRLNDDNSGFHIVYTFPDGRINHIHRIIEDKFRNRVWVFTGDFGNAAAIWYTDDNFSNVYLFKGGDPIYRLCVAYPVADGLIYATDTPSQSNYIRKITLSPNFSEENLFDIDGSCIYGTVYKQWLIWSTSVEPNFSERNNPLDLLSYKRASGIKTWESVVLGYDNNTGIIKEFYRFEKDLMPMGLCQFGSIMFPEGEGDLLIAYGSAIKKYDGNTMIMCISDSEEH